MKARFSFALLAAFAITTLAPAISAHERARVPRFTASLKP